MSFKILFPFIHVRLAPPLDAIRLSENLRLMSPDGEWRQLLESFEEWATGMDAFESGCNWPSKTSFFDLSKTTCFARLDINDDDARGGSRSASFAAKWNEIYRLIWLALRLTKDIGVQPCALAAWPYPAGEHWEFYQENWGPSWTDAPEPTELSQPDVARLTAIWGRLDLLYRVSSLAETVLLDEKPSDSKSTSPVTGDPVARELAQARVEAFLLSRLHDGGEQRSPDLEELYEKMRQLSREWAKRIASNMELWSRGDAIRSALRMPVDLLLRAYSLDAPEAVLLLTGALESLFLGETRSEITEKFCARIAWWLVGPNSPAAERREKYDQLKRIYGSRSTLAHGGREDYEACARVARELEVIVREILQRILLSDPLFEIFSLRPDSRIKRDFLGMLTLAATSPEQLASDLLGRHRQGGTQQ